MKRINHSALTLLVAGASAIIGCTNNVSSSSLGKLDLVASASSALRASHAMSDASSIQQINVSVSGGDLGSPITSTLSLSNGQWTGELDGIPAGSNMTVQANAVDGTGVALFSSTVSGVSVGDGQTAMVAMVLQEDSPAPSFADDAPVIQGIEASTTAVAPGGQTSLYVMASQAQGEPLTYAWTATGGSFDVPSSNQPTWTAPSVNGTVAITATVTDSQGTSTSMTFPMNVGTGGNLALSATINAWPVVSLVTANPTRINAGDSTTVAATASDADGDALTYQWTADCAGSFADPTAATTSFTLASLPSNGLCNFAVNANDGRGGLAQGILQVTAATPPVLSSDPVIDLTSQSATIANSGDTLAFNVQAHSPQGQPLTFQWWSDQGTISGQTDSSTTSQITWTAPASFSSTADVEITVWDPVDSPTYYDFWVQPSGDPTPIPLFHLVRVRHSQSSSL